RVVPLCGDPLDRHAHADRVDFAIGRDAADNDREIVFAAARIDDVGKEKRLALGLGEPADKLPAHQGVHLGILVDRPVDLDEEAAFLERGEMLAEIGVVAPRLAYRRPSQHGRTRRLPATVANSIASNGEAPSRSATAWASMNWLTSRNGDSGVRPIGCQPTSSSSSLEAGSPITCSPSATKNRVLKRRNTVLGVIARPISVRRLRSATAPRST